MRILSFFSVKEENSGILSRPFVDNERVLSLQYRCTFFRQLR